MGHYKTLFPPELAAHNGERIGESGAAFAIPRTGRDSLACLRRKLRGQQGDQGEQAEQAGRCACDGLVRPLALRFHPEVVAHLAERDFQLPALDEPAQVLERAGQAVEFPDDERIAVAQLVEEAVQLRTVPTSAGGGVLSSRPCRLCGIAGCHVFWR